MKRTLIPALALALAACGGTDTQTEQDEPPKETQTAEQMADKDAEAKEAAQAEGTEKKDIATRIEQAATGEHRSQENIARNDHRHPVETLTFFGMTPEMTVVELWPGLGWYTEVLAPTLTDGKLIAASFAPRPEEPDHYVNRIYKEYEEKLQNDEVYANVELGMLQPGQKVDMGEPGSADMVVTFRNFHSFINAGIEDEVLAESYKVLEPGGILGVVQHRAPEGADAKESAKKGYVPEAFVIEKAKAAGFELVEKSEVNANPKDTKDYAEGVWTLPPSYRLGDKDRAKYEAIGESDRMTLKFRKPVEEQ